MTKLAISKVRFFSPAVSAGDARKLWFGPAGSVRYRFSLQFVRPGYCGVSGVSLAMDSCRLLPSAWVT